MYKYKKLLDIYLQDYLSSPYSKRLLTSIMRFEDMYNPKSYLYGGRFMPGYVDDLKELKSRVYLTNKKLIKSFDTKKGKVLMLTSSGEKVLFKMYPLSVLRKQPWDGFWTVVSYDIPSKDNALRNDLRYFIKNFGFGRFQDSLYLSPLDIGDGVGEYFDTKNIGKWVQILRAKSIYGESNEHIASKLYNLSQINNLYKDLSNNYNLVTEDKEEFKKWKDYFIAVNYKDPYLPFELLPQGWEGDNCEQLFRNKKSRNIFKLLLKK